jgi:hypothetical protein
MTEALPAAPAPPGGALVVPRSRYNRPMQERKRTNVWPWVAGGCVLALIALAGFIVFIVTLVLGAIRSSEPYETAVQRARSDARVVAALGAPLKPGLFVSGSIKVENGYGYADIDIPISGPKQKATLSVVGTKTRGRWSYEELVVTPENGAAIDLRTSTERSPSTAPPAE